MPCDDHAAKRARARALRRAGWSRAQIAREIEMRSNRTLSEWIADLPQPEWTKRHNAKDELRRRAEALRLEGHSYGEMVNAIGVSRASCSLWLRNILLTDEQKRMLADRNAEAYVRRSKTMRARTDLSAAEIKASAASEIGRLSQRELFIAGVVAYWAEGSKSKPWTRQTPQVKFINSDPTMILLFLRWLESLGIGRDSIEARVSIHQSADVSRATQFWSEVVGIPTERFAKPGLKRHNPNTKRQNIGLEYVGCLTIRVRRSTRLLRRITGWYEGIVRSLGPSVNAASTRSFEVRGSGSTPEGPAKAQSTLFERAPSYECQRAV